MTRREDPPAGGQAERLLAVIETHRAEECGRLLGAAREEARRLVRQAFRDARRRLREGVREQRLRSRRRVDDALARLHTLRRAREQETVQQLLALGWGQMAAALQRRWQDPHGRQRWCDGLIEQARAALPAGRAWRIRHPPDWAEEEREAIAAVLTGHGLPPPLFTEDRGLAAGLRIETDGALLDGTAEGLLYDRTAVEAMLLAAMVEG